MKPEAIGWRNSHHVSSCYKKRLPSPADHQTLKKQFTTSSYSALQKRYSFKMKVVVFSVAVVAMILMATSSQAARVRLMLKLNVTHTRTCTIISCLSKQMDGWFNHQLMFPWAYQVIYTYSSQQPLIIDSYMYIGTCRLVYHLLCWLLIFPLLISAYCGEECVCLHVFEINFVQLHR